MTRAAFPRHSLGASTWVILAMGCGRLGFDPGADGAAPTDAPDASPTDAPDAAETGLVTVTFGDRPDATFQDVVRDTFISNEVGEASLNFGASADLRLGASARTLIAFDLSVLPPSIQVTTTNLTLTVTQANPAELLVTRALLEAWTEGAQDGTGGVANFGDRTSTERWTSSGGGSSGSAGDPLDFVATGTLGQTDFFLPGALVQSWIDSPGTNHGIIVLANDDQITRLASSEAPTATDRPLLTITYRP